MKIKLTRKIKFLTVLTLVSLILIQNISVLGASNKSSQFDAIFEHYSIITEVTETIAQTNVTLVYHNPTDTLTRGIFSVIIPDKAYATNISMKIDNNTYWGRILEIKEAVESFENASEAGESAVLLREILPQNFQIDFSISNLSRVSISFYYVERLIRVFSSYELINSFNPSNFGSPLSWKIDIHIQSPKRLIMNVQYPNLFSIDYISSQEVKIANMGTNDPPSGPLVISFELKDNAIGSNIFSYSNGQDEFFVATFSPVLEDLGSEQIGKDFVFLIDTSGSMSGLKMTQARDALLSIIDRLFVDDRFGVIEFNSVASAAQSELVSRTDNSAVANLKNWVSNLVASGGTNIFDALTQGMNMFDINLRPKVLVLLTDGRPTAGITNPATIEEEFSSLNAGEIKTSLFALGFGNNVNFPFLQSISRANDGDALKISEGSDATEQITEFYDIVSTPILVELTVNSISGVSGEIYPFFLSNLYEGSEILLTGQRDGIINITIAGKTSNGEESWILYESQPSNTGDEFQWVEQLYAIAKIDDLLTQITFLPGDVSSIEAEVLELALHYGIVTPYTAIFIDTTVSEEELSQETGYRDQGQPEGNIPGQSYEYAYATGAATTVVGTQTVNGSSTTETVAASLGFEYIAVLLGLVSLIGFRIKGRKN